MDALDLSAFYAPYEGDRGRNAPYEPSMMVKVMKTSTEGFEQCYNAQMGVDEAHQIIVATDV